MRTTKTKLPEYTLEEEQWTEMSCRGEAWRVRPTVEKKDLDEIRDDKERR